MDNWVRMNYQAFLVQKLRNSRCRVALVIHWLSQSLPSSYVV